MHQKYEAGMTKKELRGIMLGQRSAMTPEALGAIAVLAQGNLIKQRVWKEAKSVAFYKPIRNETETELLLDTAGAECKKVYLPRVRKGCQGVLDFASCMGTQDLVRGAYDILEPNPDIRPSCIFTDPSDCPPDNDIIVPPPDLFVVPGVAFTRSGQRLGYGGGYYDRLLANPLLREHSFFVGLGYSFQLVDFFIADPWDQVLDAVCTDLGYEEAKKEK